MPYESRNKREKKKIIEARYLLYVTRVCEENEATPKVLLRDTDMATWGCIAAMTGYWPQVGE